MIKKDSYELVMGGVFAAQVAVPVCIELIPNLENIPKVH